MVSILFLEILYEVLESSRLDHLRVALLVSSPSDSYLASHQLPTRGPCILLVQRLPRPPLSTTLPLSTLPIHSEAPFLGSTSAHKHTGENLGCLSLRLLSLLLLLLLLLLRIQILDDQLSQRQASTVPGRKRAPWFLSLARRPQRP